MNKAYMLVHKRLIESDPDGENAYSTILLGFFSSELKVKDAIGFYLNKAGFKDFPDDFKIKTVYADVDDFNSAAGDFADSVFYLAHEYSDGEYDRVSDLGFYSSSENAEKALIKYKAEDEYKKYPDGFSVDEYRIDETEWNEGFFVY